jgi:two-component system, cell cycle sensor histidine kinase and response regulator CckA
VAEQGTPLDSHAPAFVTEGGRGLDAEWLLELLESLPGAVYLVTVEGDESRTLYASPRAGELLGIPQDEVEPLRIRELLHPDDLERVMGELPFLSNIAEPVTLEYRIIRPDGSTIWIEDTTVFIPADGDRPLCAQGHLLDITDRKRLEEQLRHAQKMEAVGQLAGGIAHDFNNILTAIQGHTEFALAQAGDDALRADLVEIRRAAERAADLTRQILAFGRRQIFHSQPIDLNDVIDDTRRMILRLIGEHIEVVSHLEVSLGTVMADPAQLGQVLVNLALNARDAMSGGGRLTIETANVVLDELAGQSVGLEPGRYVVLRVTDTGHGMDAETVQRAFEPFFTTKPVGQGTGLGLSMVDGIAHQSGGRATIYSEPGRGTVVRVYLPCVEVAPLVSIEHVDMEAGATGGGRTILLVEDETEIRRLAARMLELHEYTVLTARDGYDALRIAERTPVIDLLITDVVMPGMSGVDLAERLTAVRPRLPVLYVSGYPAGQLGGRALDAGAMLLEKPFSSARLRSSVREALA